tara:strand:+ start:1081 stop:1245 length:165 start_codon:yes stop_codon:yes gene_type:complete
MLDRFTVILNNDGTFNIEVDGMVIHFGIPASEITKVAVDFRESVTDMMLSPDAC